MDLDLFFKKIPYLYHLTDKRNLDEIITSKKLFSTKELFRNCGFNLNDQRLYTRRPKHLLITNNSKVIHIRDQRPLNKALNNCLIDGCTVEEFIFLLNSRVFFWPNLKRLKIHFGRYVNEKPIILKLNTKEIIELNADRIEITNINSGATRPSGKLGGKAALRGKNTFKKITDYDLKWNTIAEITVLDFCALSHYFYISKSPDGIWNGIKLQ